MTDTKQIRLRNILAYVCPAAALFLLNVYLDWPREISHSVLLPAAVCGLGWCGRLYFRQEDRRLKRCAILFGFMFVIAQVCGAKLDASGTIADAGKTAQSFLLMFASSAMLAPSGAGLFVGLVQWMRKMQKRPAVSRRLTPKMVFWLSFALIMLSWLPALLAYWPGIISYDIQRQVLQLMTGDYNDHNPIAHTLLIGCFYRLGLLLDSQNTAFACYCIFQMAVTAFTMAFVLRFLWRTGCPRWFCVCLLLVFCFAPFHQLLSISTTKDILFTDALVIWAVLMAEGICDPEKRRKADWNAGWILSALAASLMRTNGIAAIAAVLIFGFFLFSRNRELRRRVMSLTLAALVGYFGVHTAMVEVYDAESGPFHEVLSVPIQQMCRLLEVNPYVEERYEIYGWIPDADLYQPALTDYVKHTADLEPEHMPEFLSLWARLGMRFPIVYLDAFGFLTKGYWQLDDMSHATFRGELLEYHEGYLGTIFRAWPGIAPDSKWPALYDWYEQMYSVNRYLEIPYLSVLTSTALWCWGLMALLLASLYLRRRETVLPLAMCFFMYVLLYLGPCCIVRYVYPFMFIVPLCLGVLISPFGAETENALKK